MMKKYIVPFLFCKNLSTLHLSVKAEWSSWSSWSSCTQPCGNGALKRRRVCSNALYGGEDTCDENEKATSLKCNPVTCPGNIK